MKKFSVIPVFIASLLATQALALPNPVGGGNWMKERGRTSSIRLAMGIMAFWEGGSLSSCWIAGVFLERPATWRNDDQLGYDTV